MSSMHHPPIWVKRRPDLSRGGGVSFLQQCVVSATLVDVREKGRNSEDFRGHGAFFEMQENGGVTVALLKHSSTPLGGPCGVPRGWGGWVTLGKDLYRHERQRIYQSPAVSARSQEIAECHAAASACPRRVLAYPFSTRVRAVTVGGGALAGVRPVVVPGGQPRGAAARGPIGDGTAGRPGVKRWLDRPTSVVNTLVWEMGGA